MQVRSLILVSAATVLAAFSPSTVQASTSASTSGSSSTEPYTCTTDAYCEKTFPGTSCITVSQYGETVSKCTPNTKARPACRGAQPGLCPSYQSAEVGYLNTQCVFVAKDTTSTIASATTSGTSSASASTSSSGSGRRLAASSSSGSGSSSSVEVGSTSSSSSATSSTSTSTDTTTVKSSVDDYVTVTFGTTKVTGQFICTDVSDCENQAYDPTSCYPANCGSTGSTTQCNHQGTCTYPSIQTMSKRDCSCYAGFSGSMCSKEISGACDVDCGYGGNCVDGECVCKAGWDGKAYDGKQGKANQRCTKCTNDLACQNDQPCDVSTGTCSCGAGYGGTTCGSTEDACVKVSCGVGSCQPADNGTAICYCPICDPDCTQCSGTDCSACPSGASSLELSKSLVFMSTLLAATLGYLAL